jgi:membrane-bound metal-dependent hydrolase YbcI (DUF457 family)
MANFKKHLTVGAIVGAICGAVYVIVMYLRQRKKNPKCKFNWGNFFATFFMGYGLGAISGIAADKLEPAFHCNHRKFFHSYAFWIITGYAVLQGLSCNMKQIWKIMTLVTFVGYSTHLVLDYQTPKSLPLI